MIITNLRVSSRISGILKACAIPLYDKLNEMSVRDVKRYPLSLIALGAFIVYQLYRYSYTQSFGLILLTVFDLIVIVLVWHEWRLLRKHLPVD